ncbi:flagellar basal body L-ring protein FlgH [Gammaproteobacteria bacterium]|nr:flagellar basal body L-ring protein FlgH [Gammaproteobacteria bacterium]
MEKSLLILGLTSLITVSCTTSRLLPTEGLDEFQITYPTADPTPRVNTGSILDNGSNLYPAGRAYEAGSIRVGDIVTIVLEESAQASRVNGLTTERVSTNNVTAGIFPAKTLFDEYANLEELGSTISSTGNGTAGQSASLSGSISAVVTEVMSNGNVVIFGEKQLELNEGSEYLRVRGVVRQQDIQPNNTVLSRRLANAQFSYSGAGALARSTKVPPLTNILFGLWPF